MYDLVSVGSISMDLFFQGDSLTFKESRFQLAIGGKYVAEHFHAGLGGGGVNVAIGASRMGLKTAVVGKIGNNFFKNIILSQLENHRISHKLCDFEDDYWNISSILLTAKGERSIVHYVTPHQHLINEKDGLREVAKTQMIYLGNLPDVSLTERIEFLRFFRKRSILTVVNLGVKDCRRPKEQLAHLLSMVDILILNGHEFAELVKAPYRDIHFKDNIVKWYIPSLRDRIVVVTEGARGSYSYKDGKIFHQIAVKPEKITDTTGAGDAYTAGFISGFLKSANIPASMEKGAKYAAKILGKLGAN